MLHFGFKALWAWVMWFIQLLRSAFKDTWMAFEQATYASDHTPQAKAVSAMSCPRFIDTSLSFSDDYQIVNGVPIFILNSPESSLDQERLKSASPRELSPSTPLDAVDDAEGDGQQFGTGSVASGSVYPPLFTSPFLITHCTFSKDGARCVIGYKCGEVRVWDTDHGKMLHALKSVNGQQIIACNFKGALNNTVISIDQSYNLVQWVLDTGKVTRVDVAPDFGDGEQVDTSQSRCCFSGDDALLALALNSIGDYRIANEQEHMASHKVYSPRKHASSKTRGLRVAFLDIYRLGGNAEDLVPTQERRLKVAWKPGPHNTLNGIKFSPDGGGVLAGLSCLTDRRPGTVVLWPDWHEPGVSFGLSGTQGAWSQDGTLVVTWDPFLQIQGTRSSGLIGRCFVWELEKLGLQPHATKDTGGREYQGPMEPAMQELFPGQPGLSPRYRAKNPITLLDRDVRSVLWASFVFSPKGHNVAVCAVSRTIRVVIWDVEQRTQVHDLNTGVDRTVKLVPWADNFLSGIDSMAMSSDGRWLGLYIAPVNKGFIWNMVQGVAILDVSLPYELTEEDFFLGFGGAGLTMSMCGNRNTILLDIRPLTSAKFTGSRMTYHMLPYEKRDGTLLESVSGTDRGGNDIPITDMLFSLNGEKLGVMRKDFLVMHVFDFQTEKMFLLKEHGTVLSRFHKFNFSHDGQQLAAVMSDGKILLWELAGKPGFQHQKAQLAAPETVSYVAALNIVFSHDGKYREMAVVCLEDGLLIWVDVASRKEVDRKKVEGPSRFVACLFKADGSTAALVTDSNSVVLFDLVTRTERRRVGFHCQLNELVPFPENVGTDATLAVVGWDGGRDLPVLCHPNMIPDVSDADRITTEMAISEDSSWLAIEDFVDITNTTVEELGWMPSRDSEEARIVTVMPLQASAHSKKLEIYKIENLEKMAFSADGRRIACAGDGNQVVVWSPYGAMGCVPDYHSLKVSGILNDMDAFRKMLNRYGSAMLNVPDDKGLSILLHAVEDENVELVNSLLNYALKTNTRVLFYKSTASGIFDPQDCRSALQLAIDRRSPEIVGILIRAMYDGIVSPYVMTSVFCKTLVTLGKIYPSLFMDAIMADGMPTTIGELIVPEKVFQETGFVARTMDKFIPQKQMVQILWGEVHPGTQRCNNEVEVPALARVFPYPDCCQIGMKGLLRPLLVSGNIPVQAFSSQLVRSIISYKWEAYAHYMVLKDVLIYSIYVFLFTAYSILLGHDRDTPESIADVVGGAQGVIQAIFLALCSVFGLINLVWEVNQIVTYIADGRRTGFNGLSYWLYSKWNLLDLASSILTSFVIPAVHFTVSDRDENARESWLVALTAIILYWKLLYYAQAFRRTGPLVIMIFEILWDITFFLVLAIAIMFGFGVAFFVTFRHSREEPDVLDAFGTFDRSLMTTFGMMLGDFDTNLFYQAQVKVFPQLLFVTYMMGMMIVLLNLLISLMGDSFDRVKDNEETFFLRSQASVIDDVESMASDATKEFLEDRIMEFLHVIVPRDAPSLGREAQQTQWMGKVTELERRFRLAIDEKMEDLKEGVEPVMQRQKRYIEELKSRIRGVEGVVQDRMEALTDILMERIDTAVRGR